MASRKNLETTDRDGSPPRTRSKTVALDNASEPGPSTDRRENRGRRSHQNLERLVELLMEQQRQMATQLQELAHPTYQGNVVNRSEVNVPPELTGNRESENVPAPSEQPAFESHTEPAIWQQIALNLSKGYRSSVAPTEKPLFTDNGNHNPKRFLEQFEAYFVRTGQDSSKRLVEVLPCLSGKAAEWATFHRNTWKDFAQFQQDFLGYFWSPAHQFKVRSQIVSQSYSQHSSLSMADFFLKQVNVLNTLEFIGPEDVVVAEMMRCFPPHIQSLWEVVSSDQRSLKGALQFLEGQSRVAQSMPEPQRHPIGKSFKNTSTAGGTSSRFNPFSIPPPTFSGNGKRT